MPRLYVATFEDIAVTAAQDLFEILPAANKPIKVHAITVSQYSDVGDAAEEIVRIKVIRGHTTSGSGGAAVTPRPLDSNDAAAGATVERNNTTIASAGTAVDLWAETFNIRVGWAWWPTPEVRPRCQNAELLVVRLMAAPADSLSMSGTIVFEEQ